VRDEEKRKANRLIFAFRSPTMAGGLLAASREYFFEIGGYGKTSFRCFAIDHLFILRSF